MEQSFYFPTSQFQLRWRDSWDDWTDKKRVRLNKKVCQDCAWMYVKVHVHLYREYFQSRSESCCPGCWPWDFQPAICVLMKPGSIKRGNLSLLLGTLTALPLMLHSSAGVQQWQDQLVWFAFSILLNKYCFFHFSVCVSNVILTSISTNYDCVGIYCGPVLCLSGGMGIDQWVSPVRTGKKNCGHFVNDS